MIGIEIEQLGKSYGRKQVLSDIDVTIDKPALYLLAGPNGSGKTTLLEVLVGLRSPDSGSITINGMSPGTMEIKRNVGFLAQQNSLRKNSTVIEEVELVRDLYGVEVDTREFLGRYGLAEYTTQRTKNLSGGTRRRLLIAMMLLPRYQTVVLDEPASGLDTSSRNEIWNTLRDYARENIVFVSDHYLNEAASYSDYTYLMNKGRIVLHGPTQQLLDDFALRYVIKARAEHADAMTSWVRGVSDIYEVRISGTVCSVFFNADEQRLAQLLSGNRTDHTMHRVNLEDIYFFHTGDVYGEEVVSNA